MRNFEPTIKEYVIGILHRWRFLILLSLAVAVTMAAIGYSMQVDLNANWTIEAQQQSSSNQSIIREREAQIIDLLKKKQSLDMQISESILLQADPYSKQVASVTLSVDVPASLFGTGISEGMTTLLKAGLTRTTNHYTALLKNISLAELLNPILSREFKEDMLREAISVESLPEGIICITFIGSKEFDPLTAAMAVANFAISKKDLVTQVTQDHSIVVFNQSRVYLQDTDLAELQANISKDKKEIDQNIAAIQAEVENLRAKTPDGSVSVIYIVRQFFKGLLAGGLLGIMIAGIKFLSVAPVQLPEQIQNTLHIRLLGIIDQRYPGICGRVYARLLGITPLNGEKEALELLSANLSETFKDHHKVLLTGSLPEETVSDLAHRLQPLFDDVELLPTDSVSQSADAVLKLQEADAVVLVERLQVSRMENVTREMERIEFSGKKILGYILC